MLVLTRKLGESVVIGGKITVTVIESRGEVVRLGIDAPKEVPVHRLEVFERIRAERTQLDDHQGESQSAECSNPPPANTGSSAKMPDGVAMLRARVCARMAGK